MSDDWNEIFILLQYYKRVMVPNEHDRGSDREVRPSFPTETNLHVFQWNLQRASELFQPETFRFTAENNSIINFLVPLI